MAQCGSERKTDPGTVFRRCDGTGHEQLSQLNYGLTACIGGLLCVFRNFDVGGLTVFLGFFAAIFQTDQRAFHAG